MFLDIVSVGIIYVSMNGCGTCAEDDTECISLWDVLTAGVDGRGPVTGY